MANLNPLNSGQIRLARRHRHQAPLLLQGNLRGNLALRRNPGLENRQIPRLRQVNHSRQQGTSLNLVKLSLVNRRLASGPNRLDRLQRNRANRIPRANPPATDSRATERWGLRNQGLANLVQAKQVAKRQVNPQQDRVRLELQVQVSSLEAANLVPGTLNQGEHNQGGLRPRRMDLRAVLPVQQNQARLPASLRGQLHPVQGVLGHRANREGPGNRGVPVARVGKRNPHPVHSRRRLSVCSARRKDCDKPVPN